MAQRISTKGSLKSCLSTRLSLCYLQMFGLVFFERGFISMHPKGPKTLFIKHLVFLSTHLGQLQFHMLLNRIKKKW